MNYKEALDKPIVAPDVSSQLLTSFSLNDIKRYIDGNKESTKPISNVSSSNALLNSILCENESALSDFLSELKNSYFFDGLLTSFSTCDLHCILEQCTSIECLCEENVNPSDDELTTVNETTS